MTATELKARTCCFTGHRNLPSSQITMISQSTANIVKDLIINNDVRYFGVGGAIGYDTLSARILFSLKESEFPYIKIILVYPFDGFTSRWTQEQTAEFQQLLPKYDKVVCISGVASKEAYLTRNRHLVDGSAYCICYCNRGYGGTAYTVKYAKNQGLTIYNTFSLLN